MKYTQTSRTNSTSKDKQNEGSTDIKWRQIFQDNEIDT